MGGIHNSNKNSTTNIGSMNMSFISRENKDFLKTRSDPYVTKLLKSIHSNNKNKENRSNSGNIKSSIRRNMNSF